MSIVSERLDGGVHVIRLDRPERRNAMDSVLLARLVAALAELAADEQLAALVFSTTNVKALSVGADVSEQLSPEQGQARMRAFGELYAAIEAFPLPTIAVMVGNVLGAGAELAAGCDLRVAGDTLDLGWVGTRLGIPVGPARLVPLVGAARAKELIYTARRLTMDDALALGLATHSAPAADAEAAAIELATTIAAHGPASLRATKRLFRTLGEDERRVALENEALEEFQRSGRGLPQGPRS